MEKKKLEKNLGVLFTFCEAVFWSFWKSFVKRLSKIDCEAEVELIELEGIRLEEIRLEGSGLELPELISYVDLTYKS